MNTDIGDKLDVCVYLCFILDSFGTLSESLIGEIILSASPTDYFDTMGNIGFMLDKGLIAESKDKQNGESVFSLTEDGSRTAKSLSSQLPPTLKERTLTEGSALLSRNDRERSVQCSILHDRAKDRYDLNVKFLNELNGDTLLNITLYAPSEKKALEMRDRFLAKPALIITRTLNMFLKDDFFIYDNKLTEEPK